MNRKIGKLAIAAGLLIAIIVGTGQPVHAQGFNLFTRADRASYVPGDSGTLAITITNTGGTPIQLNNLTVYFPWAGFDSNGKWQGNQSSTYTNQFIGAAGGSSSSTFTTSVSFTIPSWYGQTFSGFGNCPGGATNTRYGQYSNCVVVGIAGSRYDAEDFTGPITMAIATYTPVSLVSQAIPIATLVVLVIAVALLGMIWTSNRRQPSK